MSKRKPRIVWKESSEDGDIGYWGSVKGHPHLCFSVWIHASEDGGRLVELCAWTSEGDNPDVEHKQTLPTEQWPWERIRKELPKWQKSLVKLAAADLRARLKVVKGLL